nr:immunoglobulin light chain junction region [Macaca mulatta]MOV67810.1 immunoglobulin light chain junction region [Macaca mulatta]MOV69373.1 immunoglobulin light chain junction region [Macaca mulatta]MOV70022.1 immunoglobulin light chain junction region [Macaca mulatta]MOV70265.1 immunoglobulin light chain junction region [Macaca mulatta]
DYYCQVYDSSANVVF